MICRILGVAVLCAAATSASAQSLPAEPVTFGDGRVVLGGEVNIGVGELRFWGIRLRVMLKSRRWRSYGGSIVGSVW